LARVLIARMGPKCGMFAAGENRHLSARPAGTLSGTGPVGARCGRLPGFCLRQAAWTGRIRTAAPYSLAGFRRSSRCRAASSGGKPPEHQIRTQARGASGHRWSVSLTSLVRVSPAATGRAIGNSTDIGYGKFPEFVSIRQNWTSDFAEALWRPNAPPHQRSALPPHVGVLERMDRDKLHITHSAVEDMECL
jgi:hypothetical protein